MKRVCIIGASGKLGQYMVGHALERDYQVVGVCRERSVGVLHHSIGDRHELQNGRLADRKEGKMKRILTLTIIVMALAACTALPSTQVAPEPTATAMPQPGLPNPASVYCRQGGNQLEIRTAADGSQYGVCIFADGSTCDEWAYYRGECGPRANASGGAKPPESAEKLANWWGVIRSTPPGAQFDDTFERRDLGQVILFGIDSLDPAVRSQIVALRDSGKIVHLWGTLLSNVPDVNGAQIQVDRIEVEE